MSELTRYMSDAADIYPLDWDVSIDRRTGSPAFINRKAALTILVLSPDSQSRHTAQSQPGDKWIANLVCEKPLSNVKPATIACASTELELIIKIEEVLEHYADENQRFLEALALLQRTGLIIETPIDVVAGFVGSGMSVPERIKAYLNLGTPLVSPGVFSAPRFQAALEEIGLSQNESERAAARLECITQTLNVIQQQMQ